MTMRIAYLIGIPGTGKSLVAKKLLESNAGRIQVMCGDHVLHWTAVRLCPYLKPGHAWDTEFWRVMVRNTDLVSAFRRTIMDMINCKGIPGPETGTRFLAEATLLGDSDLRSVFHDALKQAGYAFAESRVFCLDVPPDEVLRRIKQRGRENEAWIKEAEITRRHADYEPMMASAEVRSADSVQIESAIRTYLLGNAPAPDHG
jgi:hypothetical protein